jgi:oligoribonuclease
MNWLLWIDLETTGLDVQSCHILQIACILTDFKTSIFHSLPEINIKTNDDVLQNMDSWCQNQHTNSGLIEKVNNSKTTILEAQRDIINFLIEITKDEDIIYVAGNSVHFDKKFIDYHLPILSKKLDYRIIDVSSIALICKNLNEELYNQRPIKKYLHTAESDLLESIMEYRFYKEYFLKIKN